MTTKLSTTARGRAGEDRAVQHLEREGFVVVARNVHVGHDEIDIVATDGDTLCFVEVRRRAKAEAAMISIGPTKRSRLVRGAMAYLRSKYTPAAGAPATPPCRFDVVVVEREGCTLLKNAFVATARDLGYGDL